MFTPIPEALDELSAGRMVILTDDEGRENEGDLVLPAQFATPEAINFMLSVARGYLCLSLTAADCDRLDLHPQGPENTSVRGTPFTVSIDGHPRHGFTTGVSAKERAKTVRMAIDPASRPGDFVRPGHINPLRSRDGGVLVRTGQTEGSLDLCRMAGLYPAALIIEVMREDGEMARLPDLVALAEKHRIRLCSVAQVIQHRLERESLVRRLEPLGGRALRTDLGEFTLYAFGSAVDPLPHLALCAGGVGRLDSAGRVVEAGGARGEGGEPTLVRVHRRHLLGDVLGDLGSSREGATSGTLRGAMRAVQRAGRGVVLYLRPEGDAESGSFEEWLHVPARARGREGAAGDDAALPPAPGRARELGIGSQVLRALGVRRMRLLTNHATEWPGLEAFGLEIVERVPIRAEAGPGGV
ncbi:MAG: 3,4-dihydroxy-2-butanone-4-phosphate synthase [Phycisphaerales bacterium]